jgi:hypothetical protein
MATTPKVDPAMSIVDCHVHFIDAGQFRYPIFSELSPGFEALVGNYSALPRHYLPADYLADAAGLHIDGTVCAEFMSSTPFEELRWAQSLADGSGHPSGTIACVDFRDPDVEHTIEAYRALGRVRAVRQHLAWHPTSDLLRFAQAPDLLDDVDWRRGLASLRISRPCLRNRDLRHAAYRSHKSGQEFPRSPAHSADDGLADRLNGTGVSCLAERHGRACALRECRGQDLRRRVHLRS